MRADHFQTQMNRLIEQFGKGSYGTERCKIIWQEVQDFDSAWLTRAVDKFIGECRMAPLMPEFREEIARERERIWQIQRKTHAAEAREFYHASYPPDDVRGICRHIVARVLENVNDLDFDKYQQLLKKTAQRSQKDNPILCSQCEDKGLVFTKGNFVYRCRCEAALRHPKQWPVYQHE